MQHTFHSSLVVALTLCLYGCINPLPSEVGAGKSDPAAVALLEASAEAHGGDERFARVTRIDVSYDGQWLNNIWRVQPMLVDYDYRQSSEETIAFGDGWPVVAQVHRGPGGVKTVRWPAARPDAETIAGGASVRYDGEWVPDPEERVRVEEAAAMVAEAYRMFLTGPFYFTQRRGGGGAGDGLTAVSAEPAKVAGVMCDQVLVELRPGLGTSEADRVLVSIGQDDRLVRRVRFSLDGFRKTRGATADVLLDGFAEVEGLTFPTEFLEVVVHPIRSTVHEWEAVDLSVMTE
ncbi:MAG: hypothetical protein AAF800_07795 [Planctomycetota bacterium]